MFIKLRNKLYNITNFSDIKWEANDLTDSSSIAAITVTFNDNITNSIEYQESRSIMIDLDNSFYSNNTATSQLESYVSILKLSQYDKRALLATLYNMLMEHVFDYITERMALKEEIIDITDIIDAYIEELIIHYDDVY